MLFDYFHLGVLYYEQNNMVKAREYFQKQITNNDYFAEPYYYIALIDFKENKKGDAKKNIETAIDYYSKSRTMKDPYTNIIDKVYKKDLYILQEKLNN